MLGGYLEQREDIYGTTYGLKYIYINIVKIREIQLPRRLTFTHNYY